MDFMKWLNSLGDLLYEVMSWLVFYPITLWRTSTRPLAMMRYSDTELNDAPDEQFNDTLNPPLFLILSLLLTQAIDQVLGGGVNPIVAKQTGLASLVTDNTTLLALRLVLFSLFPLIMATCFVRAHGVGLTRESLKAPFYAQCYACGPFALTLGLGTSIAHLSVPHAQIGGVVLALAAIAGYLVAETLWFSRHVPQGIIRALGNALRAFFEAALFALIFAWVFLAR